MSELNRTEKSILLYVETCCVDHGGMLEGVRMNADDYDGLKKLQEDGVLTHGRIPAMFLVAAGYTSRGVSHWARLSEKGWKIAHKIRREQSAQLGPFATAVMTEVDNRATFNGDPDDQQAVRDFLNAHPNREASDGGRLG